MIDPSGVKQLSDLELDAAALTVLFPKELMDQAFTLYDFQRDSDSGDYQFELAWDAARWTIIPDLLVIDAPRLQVSGEQGVIAAQLTAVIDLAGLPFLISLEMPAGRGAAYLLAAEAGKPHRLGALTRYLQLDGLGFDDLALAEAFIVFEVDNASAMLHVELADAWRMGPLTLDAVKLDLRYTNGTTTGEIVAESSIEIGGSKITIHFSATHAGPDEGWQFEGDVTFPPEATLKHLLEHFDFSGTEGLSDLLDWGISSLVITYDTSDNFLTCQTAVHGGSGNWQIIPGIISLGPTDIMLESVAGDIAIDIASVARIGGVDWQVVAEFPALRGQAAMLKGELYRIAPLLEMLHMTGFGLDDITIAEALVLFDGKARSAIIHVELGSVWQIGPLQLNDVKIDFSYKGGSPAEVSGQVLAALELTIDNATEKLSMSGTHEGAGQGWQINGDIQFEKALHIAAVVAAIAPDAADLLEPIERFGVTELELSLDSHTGHFTAICTAFWGEGEERGADTAVILLQLERIRNPDNTYHTTFSGHLSMAGLTFDLLADHRQNVTTLLARYHNDAGTEVPLGKLLAAIDDEAADILGDPGPSFKIKDVLFVYQTGGKFLFAVDMDMGLDLAGLGQLPLIGQALPKDQQLLLAFEPIVTPSAPEKMPDITSIQALLPAGSPQLPGQLKPSFNFITTLQIGEQRQVLWGDEEHPPAPESSLSPAGAAELDTSLGSANTPPSTSATDNLPVLAAANPDGMTWIDVQKHIGPLELARLGIGFHAGNLDVLLDAALTVGPMTVALSGLGVEYNLKSKALSFMLQGLGLDYRSGDLAISGAFLKQADEFTGMALIKTTELSLSALGAYGTDDTGHPSLFIYAFLDYPLGGPTFFFVRGMAFGFGYNRKLRLPEVQQVRQFPLIQEVLKTMDQPSTAADTAVSQTITQSLTTELQSLHDWLTPQDGEYFLAVGVRFTSFEILDSFVLLTISLGQQFAIDVVGISQLVMPRDSGKPQAKIELALRAHYAPAEGLLQVRAEITERSWVFSEQCHLQGSFAFFAWFKSNAATGANAGDFVLSMGGYHPDFKPPAHYPQNLKRLGFDWLVDSNTTIKGELYFAMTPTAVMAGGRLEAHWHSGSMGADFVVTADFLIAWEPYHYEAHISLEIQAYAVIEIFWTRTRVSMSVGADLLIWGPEFGGRGHIHFSVCGIGVGFDASFGAGKAQPPPLAWPAFRKAFLPQDEQQICTIQVQSGLVRIIESAQAPGETHWIINPRDFRIATNSVVPIKIMDSGSEKQTQPEAGIGIAPMALGAAMLTTTHVIRITWGSVPAGEEFVYTPMVKGFPTALWGESANPADNLNSEMRSAWGGFTITPHEPVKPGATAFIQRRHLSYDVFAIAEDAGEHTQIGYDVPDEAPQNPAEAIAEAFTDQHEAREGILAALGIELRSANRAVDQIAATLVLAPTFAHNRDGRAVVEES
ncbi:MAG: hypothetical protein IPM76_26150 [Chloroflexi bacterium]|nr:hypothetical protein [Chloroflexota bacterium]